MSAIADIKAQISVPDALELLGLEVPARIPGHTLAPNRDEAEPSLWVDEDHFYDFGTGEGGDVIDLVMYVAECSHRKAVQFLEQGTVPDGERLVRESPKEREVQFFDEWLEVNEVRDETKRAESLFWAHKLFEKYGPWVDLDQMLADRVVVLGRYNIFIPHDDYASRCVGVKTRTTSGEPLGKKSAVTGSTFTSRLYRPIEHALEDAHLPAVLVEGESDTWVADAYFDYHACVYGLPAGAAVIRPSFIDELNQHSTIYIATDNDAAGNKAAGVVGNELVRRGMLPNVDFARMTPPEGLDFTEGLIAGWRPTL